MLSSGPVLFSAVQVVAMALSFGGTAVMVRVARPEAIGTYMLFVQSVTVLALLMQLGLAPATLRFAPLARGRGGVASTAILRRRLLACLVSTWLVVSIPILVAWPRLVSLLAAPELGETAAIALATGALLALNQVIDAYLRAFRHYKASTFIGDVMPRVLMASAFLMCFVLRVEAAWAALGGIFVGAHLCTSLGYAWSLRGTTAGECSEPRDASGTPPLKLVLGVAGTMGLRTGISILLGASALWVLSSARPHAEVAVYGVMLSIGQVVALTGSVAGRLVPQEFAILHADGLTDQLQVLVRTAATAVGLLTFATFLVLVVFGRSLIYLAYGDAYVDGWFPLIILTFGAVVDAACGLSGFVLQSTGNHMLLLRLTTASAVLNVAMSLLLVQRFGAAGIAVSTTVSLVCFNVGMVLSVRRRLGIITVAYVNPAVWGAALRRSVEPDFLRSPGETR